MKTNLFSKDRIKLYSKNAIKNSSFSLVVLLLVFTVQQSFAQNSMVGDGFGGNAGYTPTNYGVGSYTGYANCNGTLKGWGSNNFNQLGNGGTGGTVSPVDILTNVKYFSAGYNVGAIKNDNSLWVWGGGCCTVRTENFGTVPRQIDTNVKFVSAGNSHLTYCKNDGTAWVAGDDGAYCLYCPSIATPHQVIGISNCVRTAVSYYNESAVSIFLLNDGTVKFLHGSTALQVIPITNVVDIKGSFDLLFLLKSDGSVWQFDAIHGNVLSQKVFPSGVSIKAISTCNDGYACFALSTSGDVYSWIFGDEFFVNTGGVYSSDPEFVTSNVKDIMVGETFSYIVKNDGTLWASGSSREWGATIASIWMNLPNNVVAPFTQINPYVAPMNLCAIVSGCNAGTTAPILSGTAINSSCSSTTVNLNTLVTSSTPSGAALVWFTNNAHSGTAYATPTAATAGTYYAFYYDSTNSCYSPATVAVTVTIISPPSVPTVASTTQPTCSVSTGTIVFTTQSGVEYSVDNGGTYQTSPTFSGLTVGTYTLRVRSTTDISCSTVAASPVTITAATTTTTPNLMVSGALCNGTTYTVNYSSNGVVTSSAGTVTSTAITGIPVGTNALITATTTNGCASTTTTVTSPASCTTPPVGCITPTLNVGSGVCSGTGTYSVSVSASSGATITSTAGTVFGYLVTGIPLATEVTITATSGTCTNSVTVSSPTNCTTPCATAAVSYSLSSCLGTTYTVFIGNPNSATITATAGTVSATAITNIPIGTNVTLTATATGCTSEIVTLNSPASCVIDAITETTDAINGTIGGTTSSLTTNDTLNGIPVVIGTSPGNVTLTAVSFPIGLTLNTATGQVTVAANTPAGTYPLVYSICDVNNIGVCDTVTSYIVVVIADFTPTIDIDNVVFLSAGVTRDFVVNISNIESGLSVGQVVFKIFKQSAFTITYSPTTTSSNVSGGISVNNNDWLFTENASFITITLKQNVIINPSTISSVGFAISRNSNIPTQTSQPITVTIVNGSGGDSLGVNNTYNVVIKAQ